MVQLVTAKLSDALAPLQEQLGLSAFVALLTIATSPGLSVNELADLVGIPQSTASRLVSVLLGRYQTSSDTIPLPLIIQEISASDPRKRALSLSSTGSELINKICAIVQ